MVLTTFVLYCYISPGRIQTKDAFVRENAKKKKKKEKEKKRKIRDLTATIYTKERCCKARRKYTTPWMAFSRIYFYTVKTFVVAFVDESILFQVPPSLLPSAPVSSFNPLQRLAFTILIFHLSNLRI